MITIFDSCSKTELKNSAVTSNFQAVGVSKEALVSTQGPDFE